MITYICIYVSVIAASFALPLDNIDNVEIGSNAVKVLFVRIPMLQNTVERDARGGSEVASGNGIKGTNYGFFGSFNYVFQPAKQKHHQKERHTTKKPPTAITDATRSTTTTTETTITDPTTDTTTTYSTTTERPSTHSTTTPTETSSGTTESESSTSDWDWTTTGMMMGTGTND